MNNFFDFISGGFFNYIGALVRLPFEKESYSTLVKEKLSNTYGMFMMTILLLALFAYIRFS